MAKVLNVNATLVGKNDLTAELAEFIIKYDEPLDKSFKSGQYVAIGMTNEKNPEKGSVTRSMSIASGFKEKPITELSFYIRRVSHPASDNPLTHLLWEAKVGDKIYVTRKPVGRFTVEDTMGEDDKRMVLCVAAGTGLAPFLSMAETRIAQRHNADLSSLAILHGASYEKDLGYRERLNALKESHGLRYLPSISRAKEGDGWSGHQGRVESFFKAEHVPDLESKLGLQSGGLTPENVGVLICGLQGTIEQTLLRLIPRGFIPFDRKIRKALEIEKDVVSSIWWEQYDSTPVIDLQDEKLIKELKNIIHSK